MMPPPSTDGTPAETSAAQQRELQEEHELLQRLRRGDDGAFEAVIRRFSGPLLATARRILGNSEDAQDAFQEAFLAAFRSIPSFQGDSRLFTWLHRIVVNAALVRLRRRQRRKEESIEPYLPGYRQHGHQMIPPRPWTENAEKMLQREELRELVRRHIDTLPDNYRLVLLLRDIEGLDTEATSELLGVSLANVKTRLHRARQALRHLLDPIMQRTANGLP